MWKPEVHLLIKIKILCDREEEFFLTVQGNGFQERCTRAYSLHKLNDNVHERAMTLKLTGSVIMCK